MADLSTNYMDDILAESMNGKRKYRITRADGSFEEVTLEDISEYEQRGSVFGAGDINRTNQAVNEKFDSGDVVDPMETTVPGFAADALAVKNQFNEQNKNLNLKYDEESGMIYFRQNGEWKEWIQAREMSTEHVLYSNPSPTSISAGAKLKLTDALINYTYYYVEFQNSVDVKTKYVTNKVSTDTLVRMQYNETSTIKRYRDITGIDNVNKTVTLGAGYQDASVYANLVLPTKIVGIGKKTIY